MSHHLRIVCLHQVCCPQTPSWQLLFSPPDCPEVDLSQQKTLPTADLWIPSSALLVIVKPESEKHKDPRNQDQRKVWESEKGFPKNSGHLKQMKPH